MTKELLAQVNPLIEMTKAGIVKGVEVLQTEVPLVVSEIMRWNFFTSLTWFCIGFILFLVSVIVTCKHRLFSNETLKKTEGTSMLILFSYVIGFIIMLANHTWIKVWLCPKLFLIEYISKIL